MSIRELFWNNFSEIIFHNYYLVEYKQKSMLYNKIWKGCIAIASSASIATWALWGEFPLIWAAITASAQIATLLLPLFKFNKQIIFIEFALPELQKLINQMENTWLKINTLDEDTIIDMYSSYQNLFNSIDSKYITSLDIPDRNNCLNIAMDKRDSYLKKLLPNQESEVLA